MDKIQKQTKGKLQKEQQFVWYQFHRSTNIQVFITVPELQLTTSLDSFLINSHWTRLTPNEVQSTNFSAESKILHFEEVGPMAAKQIRTSFFQGGTLSSIDLAENMTLSAGHRVYRLQNHAMIVFSFAVRDWTLGHFSDFASKENEESSRFVINRFLAWALAPMGIIGFWGTPVEDGPVLMRPKDAHGECVFIDLFNNRQFTTKGVEKISAKYKFIKLDPLIGKDRSRRLSHEEFMGLLTQYCTYFDLQGHSVSVRQMIHEVVRRYEGHIHAQENFRQRAALTV